MNMNLDNVSFQMSNGQTISSNKIDQQLNKYECFEKIRHMKVNYL